MNSTGKLLPMRLCKALAELLIIAVVLMAGAKLAYAQVYAGSDLYSLGVQSLNFEFAEGPSIAAGGQVVGTARFGPLVLQTQLARLWTPPAGSLVDITPTSLNGFNSGIPYGTDGARQVGWGGYIPPTPQVDYVIHAVIWNGTANSAIDLHPTNLGGLEYSVAYGLGGSQQVGAGGDFDVPFGGLGRALLWTGGADSAVELHPAAGFENGSIALATDGVRQVGYGSGSASTATGGGAHALLWSGTADSVVDLNPTNLSINGSVIYGINGAQQVGLGGGASTGGKSHALLWHGAANSTVDLHPTLLLGFDTSLALGTNGLSQVGWGFNMLANQQRALLWSGTGDSAVDLHLLLPFTATSSSAYTIDPDGTVWGTATDAAGNIHAVMWTPVSEPSGLALAALGSLSLLACRRRK